MNWSSNSGAFAAVRTIDVRFSLEPRFVPKLANVPSLQIADLVARPIARHILNANQSNRAYTVIEKKLDRSPSGSVLGWGLKVFP